MIVPCRCSARSSTPIASSGLDAMEGPKGAAESSSWAGTSVDPPEIHPQKNQCQKTVVACKTKTEWLWVPHVSNQHFTVGSDSVVAGGWGQLLRYVLEGVS